MILRTSTSTAAADERGAATCLYRTLLSVSGPDATGRGSYTSPRQKQKCPRRMVEEQTSPAAQSCLAGQLNGQLSFRGSRVRKGCCCGVWGGEELACWHRGDDSGVLILRAPASHARFGCVPWVGLITTFPHRECAQDLQGMYSWSDAWCRPASN